MTKNFSYNVEQSKVFSQKVLWDWLIAAARQGWKSYWKLLGRAEHKYYRVSKRKLSVLSRTAISFNCPKLVRHFKLPAAFSGSASPTRTSRSPPTTRSTSSTWHYRWGKLYGSSPLYFSLILKFPLAKSILKLSLIWSVSQEVTYQGRVMDTTSNLSWYSQLGQLILIGFKKGTELALAWRFLAVCILFWKKYLSRFPGLKFQLVHAPFISIPLIRQTNIWLSGRRLSISDF